MGCWERFGHGVSHCGPVHEYPHYAYPNPRPFTTLIPLKSHMTITNEPGYYEEEPFGIRIENIIEKKFKLKISNIKKRHPAKVSLNSGH